MMTYRRFVKVVYLTREAADLMNTPYNTLLVNSYGGRTGDSER